MFPDFLGIGAQKSGTTWLARNLREHPGIWMPRRKEIHYFDKLRQRGQDDEWYASLFAPDEGQIAGEITPAYSILDEQTISHVHALMPEARLIFLMRNPVERMWSQAVMHFNRGQGRNVDSVTEEEFHALLDSGPNIHRRSDYPRALQRWSSFYPQESIFTGFLEDVHFHPGALLGRLHRFLGVEPSAGGRIIEEKVHSRSGDAIPASVAIRLARHYYEILCWLHEHFGGYASFWLYCAERLMQDEPEEPIPYPMWKSSLWEEWGGDTRLQSAPLYEALSYHERLP